MLAGTTPDAARETATSWKLPVELLVHCLLAADLTTRIRASHVCRAWRGSAVAEHRLWDSFACSDFLDKQHEYAMFSLLEAMLLRSRPLPFHMHIPNLDDRTHPDYVDRLLGLKGLDVFRLAAYHGPPGLFKLLNPAQAPLPNLVCLDVRRFPTGGQPDILTIELAAHFGAHCLPSLRQLVAPNIRFPADCAPFSALESITFAGTYGKHHRTLFTHCRSLVRLCITDSTMSTPLPEPPVPPSLQEVAIRSTRPRALSLAALMEHWRGVRVRRLVAHEVYSLRGILPIFCASHSHAVEMRLPGAGTDDVAFSAMPDDDSVWKLSPSPPWVTSFISSIEKPASERLTSICVAFSRFNALLRAQVDAPGLEKVELSLDSAVPLQTGEECFLRAPCLRSVFFNLEDDCSQSFEDALKVLQRSFRALIIYEAELLDTIIASPQAKCACARFSSLAREYVLAFAQA